VKRELRAFAHAAAEDTHARDHKRPIAPMGVIIAAQLGDSCGNFCLAAAAAHNFGDFIARFQLDHAVGRRQFVMVLFRMQQAEDAAL
jgi:hypothetical protein